MDRAHVTGTYHAWSERALSAEFDPASPRDMGGGGSTSVDDAWGLESEFGPSSPTGPPEFKVDDDYAAVHDSADWPWESAGDSEVGHAFDFDGEFPVESGEAMSVQQFCEKYGCASGQTAAQCYRARAKEMHPDRGGDETAFRELKSDFEAVMKQGGAETMRVS